jgi:hypothetical protein
MELSYKKEQVVAGVCLARLCLVGETCLFLSYLFWSSENREINVTIIDVQQKYNTFIGLIYEGDTVHVVTDPNTLLKLSYLSVIHSVIFF